MWPRWTDGGRGGPETETQWGQEERDAQGRQWRAERMNEEQMKMEASGTKVEGAECMENGAG